MRLAIISDIHANDVALNLTIEDIKKEKIDKVIFLGDYITDGEASNKILNIIKEYQDYAIVGNREKYILNYNKKKRKYNNYKPISYTYKSLTRNSLKYIKSLKDYMYINIFGKKILLIHGDSYFCGKFDYEDAYQKIIDDFDDFDICLYGHTHIHKSAIYCGKYFINPGSIGQPFDGATYKYCILDINEDINIILKEFDISDTFSQLESSYKKTKFYKKNIIWGNVILDGIKNGNDSISCFLNLVNKRINKLEKINYLEYNRIWNEAYQEYNLMKQA